MFCVIYQIQSLCALCNKVLSRRVNDTILLVYSNLTVASTPYLIIALCAPVLHETSWQKAVNAVSGDDCGEEETFDVTVSELEVGVAVSLCADGISLGAVRGEHASWFISRLGW